VTTRVSAEVRSFFRAEGLRLGLAAAALVLAVASRGDAFVLLALAAALSTRPTAVAALALAAVGSSWRWGASALVAWSSDQAVLGPAGFVGPTSAAAASWLAAVAVLLAVAHPAAGVLRRDARPFTVLDQAQSLVAGVVAGLIVAGPGPGGNLPARVGVAVAASALAVALNAARAAWRRVDGVAAVAAIVAGAGSVAAAAVDAPAWDGTVAAGPIRDAVVLTVAATGVVAVLRRALVDSRGARWATAGDRS
jgi:hypothetical protein